MDRMALYLMGAFGYLDENVRGTPNDDGET